MTRIALFFAFLASAAAVFAQAGLEPVPDSQVSAETLHLAAATIKAPLGWKWYRMPVADRAAQQLHPQMTSETYVAQNPNNREGYIVSVIRGGPATTVNDDFMKGMGDGMTRTAPKTGWHITDYAFGPSKIPFEGAYHFSCVATNDAGVAKYRMGYVFGSGEQYQISMSSRESEEPVQFRQFVMSFQWAKP